jgi:putative transposase
MSIFSFPSTKVVEMVKRVISWRGKPEQIISEIGTEFFAKAFDGFCSNFGIEHIKIPKGQPMQNRFVERFNRHYRDDVLDMHIFETISQVREKTEEFIDDYNTNHPHDSLGNLSLLNF